MDLTHHCCLQDAPVRQLEAGAELGLKPRNSQLGCVCHKCILTNAQNVYPQILKLFMYIIINFLIILHLILNKICSFKIQQPH